MKFIDKLIDYPNNCDSLKLLNIAIVSLSLVIVCSASLLSVPWETCASWLRPFLSKKRFMHPDFKIYEIFPGRFANSINKRVHLEGNIPAF